MPPEQSPTLLERRVFSSCIEEVFYDLWKLHGVLNSSSSMQVDHIKYLVNGHFPTTEIWDTRVRVKDVCHNENSHQCGTERHEWWAKYYRAFIRHDWLLHMHNAEKIQKRKQSDACNIRYLQFLYWSNYVAPPWWFWLLKYCRTKCLLIILYNYNVIL